MVELLDAGGVAETRTDPAHRFVGRFENLWSVIDVVDPGDRLAGIGDRLVGIAPTLADPMPSTITFDLVDKDTLRVIVCSGYGSRRELWRYERDDDGRVQSVRAGGGMTMWPQPDVSW